MRKSMKTREGEGAREREKETTLKGVSEKSTDIYKH